MRDDPIISCLERTGLPPWGQEMPVCPYCGEECKSFFKRDGEVVGCENCIEECESYDE